MTERLKIGVIGGGGIAGAHARAYHKMDDVQVVAVADIVPGKAQEFIEKHGLSDARAFADHRELLQMDLDAVSICVPNVGHHRTTVDALAAGKHVLLEKPLSVTLGEGVDMARAARRADRILSIGFQPRYDPNMKLIREMVQSGLLGKVYYVLTGGGRRRGMPGGTFIRKDLAGVGAMADIGCYSLDMALLAIGYPKPLTVSAYTSNYFGANPLYHPEADAPLFQSAERSLAQRCAAHEKFGHSITPLPQPHSHYTELAGPRYRGNDPISLKSGMSRTTSRPASADRNTPSRIAWL